MAGYLFEWDAEKAEANERKHGVTFDEAITAFLIPWRYSCPTRTTPSANGGILFSERPLRGGYWSLLLQSGHHEPV